ncbi:hypothetical protein EDC18_10492 [Natranaerovirga pectinivora]|uniref:Cell wall-active antibiotic response 4TMS protein YvqF n=1 Tax=Natranaerovirga pectinivora TaxID=682400 RepID=A0A4R3MPN6_9FIRM|nr:hypothetical protein [Natranaerovirga pectinivora]TCT14942.1 hypothetical protein EDC18_10492 [Natranaerovirga pectinivora]
MSLKKKGIAFIALSGAGFLIYKVTGKVNKLKNEYEKCFTFTGKEIRYDQEIFNSESVAAAFSAVEIDFTGAELEEDVNILDLYCEFSAISIKVPEDWNIILEGKNKKSAIQNKAINENDYEDGPKLIIKYDIRFSALEIKN